MSKERFRQANHDDMEMSWGIYLLSTCGVIALIGSATWFLYVVADWLAS